MEAKQTTQKTKKKKFSFKKLFFAIFGKARWFVLGIVICYIIIALCFITDPSMTRMRIVTDYPGEEYRLWDINSYSVSDDGMASVLHYSDRLLVLTLFDKNTGEQLKSGIPYGKDDEGYVEPFDYVAGNNGKFYGIGVNYGGENEQAVTDEYIFEFDGDYGSDKMICRIHYDLSDRIRNSQASRLNFHNDELTFAIIGFDATYLYSIDTITGNVRISEPYSADSKGNFTTLVIPMDDSFLFIQSDGSVYVTKFDEPLTNKVYQIEASVDDTDNDYFIDEAEICNGKLYVCNSFYNGKVYCIENGERYEVFDVNEIGMELPEDYYDEEYFYTDVFDNILEYENYVIDLDTIQKGNKDVLSVATELGIVAYDGENVTPDDLYVTLNNYPLLYVDSILEFITEILMLCLIVNLIIRKKTLLYKHLAITLPVLVIPTVLLSVNLYFSMQDDNLKQTRNSVEAVCRITASAFDGYDFSELSELNENTGAAEKEIMDKFKDFDTNFGEYVFSIVCRTKDGEGTVLAASDTVFQPLSESAGFLSLAEMKTGATDENVFIFDDVIGVMGADSQESVIYAYGLIDDASHSGRYYVKVQTEPWSFWTVRRNLFFEIFKYGAVIVLALTLVTILTSWSTTRTIKKATKTVGKIADGDFSARIKYKSKDELGEICSQVNTMANSLENMFDEKDKTEKFYYKFVPEKFRELLGKEHFTDLNLGDAKSRDLTVLFFDIRSFSINSEIMTAKENFEFVNIIYGKAGPIVRRHNGFVDKYIGDAVMALFENADDAVACGIELYKEIVLDPKTAEAIGIGDINIGIGIHSGMARIGIVGEDERLSGTVISDTVNISSRLESLTKQFKTAMLISKDTVDRMSNPEALKMRYLGEIQVAGVNEVKALYEVLDCLDDEECKRRFESIPEFREAVRLFHLGRRAEAAAKLKELADSGKGDYVTEKYFTYISEMSEEEKGNVFRFVRK